MSQGYYISHVTPVEATTDISHSVSAFARIIELEAEVARLKRELAILTTERDVLANMARWWQHGDSPD